ncbi:MAG: protein-export chaperone SecB [Candidatus Odyssella sp.]|nr:protein-export chaperone SecB [Candidatus Odyssella sp.]
MADNPGNGSGQNAASTDQPPLMVKGQYIKDFSFENPSAPEVFMQGDVSPQVDISVNVEARRLPNADYEVVLSIKVDAKSKDKAVFLCELAYAGVFALGPIIPQDQHQGVLLIECPRLLFPFARAIIADATREGGFPPLTLQPIDFFSLFQQQMQAQQAPRSPIIKP